MKHFNQKDLNLWVDFAVPLIGILFHQLIAKYEESVVMKNKLKNLQST